MYLTVTRDLLELGLASSTVVARGVDNTRISQELIAYRRHVGKRLAAHWKNRSISAHPVIREYHRVHEVYGVVDEPPAPEKLIMYVRRNQDFTSSGAVVDCYNIVSAKTLLSIGAHDLGKLATPVTLRECTAQDVFIPLGQTEPQGVQGEYGYVDPENRVICRFDVLQCEYSKTTHESRDVVFFLQGNRCLSSAALLKGTWLLAEMIEKFTGGKAEIADFLDLGRGAAAGPGKPQVKFEDFQGLELRKGTCVAAEPLSGMPALSAVTVDTGHKVQALAPSSTLPDDPAGQQLIIAGNLHPVTIDGNQYGAYVMAANLQGRAAVLSVESEIPDGKKLY
jgi:DNA/RNA-binding domain of Phe-tRNA-synthetase-like protein